MVGGLATYPEKPGDIGDHFVKAAYQPQDGPAQVDAQVACGVASLVKSIKVRPSSSEINAPQPKAPRLKEKPSWSPGKVMATCMDMMQTMMVRARHLDVPEPTVHLLKKGVAQTSTKALEAPPSQQNPSSSSTIALPCLPAPEETAEKRTEENTQVLVQEPKKEPDQKTLEEFEAEAFEQLEVRAAAAKGSKTRKDSLKKPAAAKVPKKEPLSRKTASSSKSKEQSKKAAVGQTKKEPGEHRVYNPDGLAIYGCSRCRGDPFECTSCAKRDFQGRRLNGRAAWQKWWEREKQKKNRG